MTESYLSSMKLLYCRKITGLPFVDKVVVSDDSAAFSGSLILSIPVSCALYLFSDVQMIKAVNLPLLVWDLNTYLLGKGVK